jgi:hypothetical protein
MNVWVYDIESYPNMFLVVFYNTKTHEFKIFEVSDRKNDGEELRIFLNTKPILIGFNNINYDYPMLHRGILTKKGKIDSYIMFELSNTIINEEYSSIWEKEVILPQLDLFKVWHYDNKNKATSLKWLEFAMRSPDVRDLPYPVGAILTDKQMDDVISYCKHDVTETYKFYKKSSKHIEIRKFYSKYEGIDLLNASEIKMSKEIFSKHLSKVMGISKYEIKKLRTYRKKVEIKDVIFDYIKFNDPINQQTLNKYKESIKTEYNNVKFTVPYKNVIREYAEGGLHSFGKPGFYKSDDEYVLIDVDFASYYPHLSFMNNLHPEHIPGEVFNKLYKGFYTERKNYPKSDPRNYVLKIILNGSYGLSKDQYSFLYDLKWQLAITVNGQLLLTMLTEKIIEQCHKNVEIIFENTDGAMYKIHRSDIDNIKNACFEMEEICKIPLEIQECDRIVARDVNNYMNVITDDNIKFKGAFEIDKDYHKNHSKRVVTIALANYFLYGIDPSDTIINYLDDIGDTYIIKSVNDGKNEFYQNYGIYDFCHGVKMKKKYDKLVARTYTSKGENDVPLARMNRYYVSNDGVELIKKLPPLEKNKITDTDKHKELNPNQVNMFDFIEDDVIVEAKDRETNIEAGYKCTLFNKFEKKDDYNINYDYYINECNKIINIFK